MWDYLTRHLMTRRTIAIILLFISCAAFAFGQAHRDLTTETQTILLWENGAPGAQGQGEDDRPTLTAYRPWQPNLLGTSVIVAPGGSYGFLADNHEGRQVANWFNAHGYHRLRAQVSPGAALSPSHRIGGRAEGDSAGAKPGRGIRSLARSHRNHGLLGGRPPGFDGRDPFRQRKSFGRRPDRSRRQPS